MEINGCVRCNAELVKGKCEECAKWLKLVQPVYSPDTDIRQSIEQPKELSERKNDGKLRMDLVPPEAVESLAKVLTYGANKYSERNWEKGHKFSTPYASLMRHLMAFWSGEDCDNESGLSHLDHVIMNAAMLIYYKKHFPNLDDRSKK